MVVDEAYHMITGLCQQADLAFDMAFAAGTLTEFFESDLDSNRLDQQGQQVGG